MEDITNDNKTRQVVKLGYARKRDVDSPERGILMASDRELLEKMRGLTPDCQRAAIEILLELLASQQTSSCSPASTGESSP